MTHILFTLKYTPFNFHAYKGNTFVKIEYEQRIKEKRKIALFNGKTVDLDNAEQKSKVIE